MAKFKDIKLKGDVVITKIGDSRYDFEFNKYDSQTGELLASTTIKSTSREKLQDLKENILDQQQEHLERWAEEIEDIDDMMAEMDIIDAGE